MGLCGALGQLAAQGVDLLGFPANGEVARHAVDDRSLEAQVDEGPGR